MDAADSMTQERATRRRRRVHTTARLVGATLLTGATVIGISILGIRHTQAQLDQRPHPTGPQPAAAAYGTGKVNVAVVLGTTGTVGTDALGPYQVFATSPTFTVYTVGQNRRPLPVQGAPWIVPARTFTDISNGAVGWPNIVVVPALDHPDAPEEQAVRDFVKAATEHGARILSVCNGGQVLAATGLLDGHRATAHWSRLGTLRAAYPKVTWVAGRRYIDTTATSRLPGDATATRVPVTTTAGITSGIAGALHVVAVMAGDDEARRVHAQVPYAAWAPGASTRIPAHHFAVSDAPALLNMAFPWGRRTTHVHLRNGESEIDIAARFEVATTSSAERVIATSATGWVTTAHGLLLATRSGEPAEPKAAPTDTHATSASATAHATEAGFQEQLDRVAQQQGTVAASSIAKMLEYPYTPRTGQGRDPERAWTASSLRAPSLATALTLLAAAFTAGPTQLLRIVRARRRG
jgi:putative intracellular protease/amidase